MVRRNRRAGLTPRAYQALLDRRRLWDLVCMQTPQSEIALAMGKDPAWVSRTIRQIQADLSTVHALPNEAGIIQENVARWEVLLAEARRLATASEGFKRISALRVCAELLRQKAEYEVTVGLVKKAPNDLRLQGNVGLTASQRPIDLDKIRGEISDEDLDAIWLTVADDIRERRAKEAKAKALPAPSEPAKGS